MSNNNDTIHLLQRSLQSIRNLKKELQGYKDRTGEGVAIVGMGCKLPGGASNPEKFWELLSGGKDAICPIPRDRWDIDAYYHPDPNVPGKMNIKEGGFLQEDVSAFDARFFGISSREAVELDPQQRYVLEVSWEALEYGGIAPDSLRGSKTGVFMGVIGSDYTKLPRTVDYLNGHTATGSLGSTLSGRVSYTLGLQGPAITLDTACSSSLVAIHLACSSIHNGECSTALAGGVNLIFSPFPYIMINKMNALSPDSRCKSFDESANGYVRSEGCGVLVLKKLSDAVKDGNTIFAVIKGSAVNQDGESSGLTVPNGLAQKQVIEECITNSAVSPDSIGFIETHGTGTPLGDPIEIKAITDIFGKRAKDNPLILGAVKSNIGHLEAASGVAGVIKIILSLNKQLIPGNIHFFKINPRIKLENTNILIADKEVPWQHKNKPRYAGISSFGFSGTNSHIIIGDYEKQKSEPGEEKNYPFNLLTISTKNRDTLFKTAETYLTYLMEHPGVHIRDFCHTINIGRAKQTERAVLIAGTTEELQVKLQQFIENEQENGGVYLKKDTKKRRKIVFGFDNLPEKSLHYGKELYVYVPEFQKIVNSLDEAVKDFLSGSLIDYFLGKKTEQKDRVIKEVLHFVIQYAAAKLLVNAGTAVFAAVGDGLGKLAAACISGVMKPGLALKLIFLKHGIISSLSGQEETLVRPKLRLLTTDVNSANFDYSDCQYWSEQLYAAGDLKKAYSDLAEKEADYIIGFGSSVDRAKTGALYSFLFSGDNSYYNYLDILAHLFCMDTNLNWFYLEGPGANRLQLPTTLFNKKRFWIDIPGENEQNSARGSVSPGKVNPLKGEFVQSPIETKQVLFTINTGNFHEIKDTHNLLHIGYFSEMLTGSLKELYPEKVFKIENMIFDRAFIAKEGINNLVALTIDSPENSSREFQFSSMVDTQNNWIGHVSGEVRTGKVKKAGKIPKKRIDSIKQECTKKISGADFYTNLKKRGLLFGESVKWIETVYSGDKELLVQFRKTGDNDRKADYALGIHPGIMDTCAQLFFIGGESFIEENMIIMVSKMENITVNLEKEKGPVWGYIKVDDQLSSEETIRGDVLIFDDSGNTLMEIKGMNVQRIHTAEESLSGPDKEMLMKERTPMNELLEGKDPEEQESMVIEYLIKMIAERFRMEAAEIDVEESIISMGIDSIIGLEIKNILEIDFEVEIPLIEIAQGPCIVELKTLLLELLEKSENKVPAGQEEPAENKNIWFGLQYKQKPGAKIIMFLFPDGMDGASVFKNWPGLMGDDIALYPIQLPGRENRIKEPLIRDFDRLLENLEQQLYNIIDDRPFTLYGHSMGALFAYRSAYRLWKNRGKKAMKLFTGAYSSPLIKPNPAMAGMLAKLKELGYDSIPENVSPEEINKILQLPMVSEFNERVGVELTSLVIPRMLGDMSLVNTYSHNLEEEPFDIPLTVFHGKQDFLVSESDMRAWEGLTTREFTLHILDGDHDFMHQGRNEEELVQKIRAEIESSDYFK